jgi:hypothetical protein
VAAITPTIVGQKRRAPSYRMNAQFWPKKPVTTARISGTVAMLVKTFVQRRASFPLRPSAGEAPHDLDQLARIEGLREVGLGVAAIGFVTRVARAGEDDERNVTQPHAQLPRERRSVDARHLHVEDDHRRWIVLHEPQCLGAVAGLDDSEAVVVQHGVLGSSRFVVVVDDQDRSGLV